MKKFFHKLYLSANQIDRRHLQVVLALVVLSLLVLGAGAPGVDPGPGGW